MVYFAAYTITASWHYSSCGDMFLKYITPDCDSSGLPIFRPDGPAMIRLHQLHLIKYTTAVKKAYVEIRSSLFLLGGVNMNNTGCLPVSLSG